MTFDPGVVALVSSVGAIVAVILGLLKLLDIIRSSAKETESRFTRLEVMTDTMWDTFLKGAKVEARQRGVLRAVPNPGEKLDPNVARQFGANSLGPRILQFYRDEGLGRYSESVVALRLAREFGDALIEQICMPLGINLGDALVAAIQWSREAEHV